MDAFPAFFPLAGAKVVIAGAGEAAEAKARLFEGSPARVARVDGPAALSPETYADALLAFVASEDERFAKAAAEAAREAGVPVNVVDRPALCDFTSPAIIDRGEVVAAVGTAGASPMMAAMLRSDIEARVPEGAGRIAALFRRHQAQVRATLPEPHRRRAFLRSALAGEAAAAASADDSEAADRLFLESLAAARGARGRIQFLAGRGPVDLLSLRAVRALASADVLAADGAADHAILDLARRDAERLGPDALGLEKLIELAKNGLCIVRIVVDGPDPADLEAARKAGVLVEILPTACA